MKRNKKKKSKQRNWLAVDAQFRNSAGAMKEKRKNTDKNKCRQFKKNWRRKLAKIEEEQEELKKIVRE